MFFITTSLSLAYSPTGKEKMGKKKDGFKKNKKYGYSKKMGKKKSGGDKGMKYYKDKGAKKKGFKKSYHKVEWGDKKKYHNNWRYEQQTHLPLTLTQCCLLAGTRTGRKSSRSGRRSLPSRRAKSTRRATTRRFACGSLS